jgi:hypothetical protein
MVLNHMTYAYDDLAPGCYLVCESIHLDSKLTLEIVTWGGGGGKKAKRGGNGV